MIPKVERYIRKYLPNFHCIYDKAPIPLQNLLVSFRGWFLTRMRYSKNFKKFLDEITAHDHWSKTELLEYQNRQIRILIRQAYKNIPFYQKIMQIKGVKPEDISTAEDLRQIPILTREDIRTHFYDLLDSNIPFSKQIIVHTSGTTGSGLPIAYGQESYLKYWAFITRQFLWVGIQPKEWRITLFGSRIVPPNQLRKPYWRINYFEKQILLSIFHLSESTKKDYVEFLKKHVGKVLEGFPTALNLVADFLLEEKTAIKMKVVYSTGEPLTEVMRNKIERAFNCKVYDCYGMTEMVGFIQECEQGRYHLISDYGLLEIVDEQGNALPPGQEGYFVWTGLQKLCMPLIRYKIGDKGVFDLDQYCPCGRPYPIVKPTITRDSDYLISPDGRIFSPRVINQFLKDKTSFRACQFIQESPEKIVIRIVPRDSHYEKDKDSVKSGLQKLLGASVVLEVIESDRPLTRAGGKIPLILNKLILNSNSTGFYPR